jgi:hypothetical protein
LWKKVNWKQRLNRREVETVMKEKWIGISYEREVKWIHWWNRSEI